MKNRWNALLLPYAGRRVAEFGYRDLIARYREPSRFYHTFAHVEQCLAHLDMVRKNLEDRFCVEMALWFHDVIYDPKARDNEKQSAKFAEEFLSRTSLPPKDIEKIRRMISLTKHPSTPHTEDECYLLDIDLAILGAEPGTFREYEKNIRMEYAFVPLLHYQIGRKKILESFLQNRTIYNTFFFRTMYELTAKENIRWAVKEIGKSDR